MKNTRTRTACVFMVLLLVAATGYSRQSIHEAAKQGALAVVERYLQEGANVDVRTKDGETPLMFAAFKGHLDVVQFLMDKGADLNVKGKSGVTP